MKYKLNERMDIVFDNFNNESTHAIRGHVNEADARKIIEADRGELFGSVKSIEHDYGRLTFAGYDSDFNRELTTQKEKSRGAFAVTIVVFEVAGIE